MKKRYIKILEYLEQSENDFVNGSELANLFNVTTRTIRNDIREINESYLDKVVISGNTQKGYKLVGNLSNIYQNEDDYEERAFHIIKTLLSETDFITYDELAKKLYFSTQTIRKDVQKLFQIIQAEKRNIEVEAIIFQGIRLKGSEVEKRLLLKKLVTTNCLKRMSLDEALQYYFDDWFSQSSIQLIYSCIEEEVTKYNLLLSSQELFSICVNIIISLKRVGLNQKIAEKDMRLDNTSFEELKIAKLILTRIAKEMNVQFDEYEYQYLCYLLIVLQILPKKDEIIEQEDSDEIKEKVKSVIKKVWARYGFLNRKNEKLFNGLLVHITKSLYPLKYYFPVENPFISQIKSEYMNAYNIAVVLAKELQFCLNIKIPENEIGYLTLHIMNIIENSQETRKRIAIIYGKNPLVGKLLERKINLYFPNIKVDGLFANYEMHLLPEGIETIVTTSEIFDEQHLNVKNCIRVSEMITNEDMKTISIQLNRGLLKYYLSPKDLYFLDEETQKGLLKTLTNIGGIQHLYTSINEREKMSSTNIGNLVAMPHPFDCGNNEKLRVLVAINKQRILWGDKMAQIIFLFIPPKNQRVNNTKFFEEIHDVFKQTNITKKLLNVANYDEFLEVWSSK
ncbi:BglG family transcription antiterminator [Priestia megaterium]|uniref:BglG family transcription antiterminator n=1 Tax=Priestia megaterium TaxID=1404 RepID=UPI001BE9269A|nr:HTH domain-containing protein [Priestia megaterium]MBT2259766.1 HTH domain-containing protein [Priestia megaterium]MBT2281184.1 HTH domain-containing protein [Priestia megaterium]